MKRYAGRIPIIICNPVAGRKKSLEILPVVEEYFTSRNIRFQSYVTRDKADVYGYTCESIAQASQYVVIGGDGTINGVIHGLSDSESLEIPVAIIPAGTGNVIARQLKLPRQTGKLLDIILEHSVARYDLWSINDKKFVFCAGVGIDSHCVKAVADYRKQRQISLMSYFRAAWESVFTQDYQDITVQIDDARPPVKCKFVLLSNINYWGGRLKVFSNANCSDGKLDICCFKRSNPRNIFAYFFGIIARKLPEFDSVEYYQGSRVQVEGDRRELIQIDGDILGCLPVMIEYSNRQVNFCMAKESSGRA